MGVASLFSKPFQLMKVSQVTEPPERKSGSGVKLAVPPGEKPDEGHGTRDGPIESPRCNQKVTDHFHDSPPYYPHSRALVQQQWVSAESSETDFFLREHLEVPKVKWQGPTRTLGALKTLAQITLANISQCHKTLH